MDIISFHVRMQLYGIFFLSQWRVLTAMSSLVEFRFIPIPSYQQCQSWRPDSETLPQDLPRFIWPLEPTDGKSSDPSVGSVGSVGGAGSGSGGAVIGTHCSTGITADVDSGRSKGFEANIGNGNVSIACREVT